MRSKSIIIQGSSRSKGDSYTFISELNPDGIAAHIDLKDYKIRHFDYESNYLADDFLDLIEKLINTYDTFIFVTPVYWYTMSGIMKVFFDRLSDLLKIRKPLGRKLRGKSMSVMSISNSDDVESSFYRPFELTAEYLGMDYLGHIHAYGNSANINPETMTRLFAFRKLNSITKPAKT